MHSITSESEARHTPWNKGRLIGQRPLLQQKEIWAIRIRLQLAQRTGDLALFNHAIDITRPSERFEFPRSTSNI